MFLDEQSTIESSIRDYCGRKGIPWQPLKWSPLPFLGEWGIATSFFQIAAAHARAGGGGALPVGLAAQQIADEVRLELAGIAAPARVEAVNGYLNFFYPASHFAAGVVRTVLAEGRDFGRGSARSERIMVEYAQPNTHHSFHIGHARNAVLGEALARVTEFAGFETIRASYPGDLGLGVITVLWAYDKVHRGEEPAGTHERGQWLLKIYSEATTHCSRSILASDQEPRRGHATPSTARCTGGGITVIGCARPLEAHTK
jgi:arginyl-tRNA synthetase